MSPIIPFTFSFILFIEKIYRSYDGQCLSSRWKYQFRAPLFPTTCFRKGLYDILVRVALTIYEAIHIIVVYILQSMVVVVVQTLGKLADRICPDLHIRSVFGNILKINLHFGNGPLFFNNFMFTLKSQTLDPNCRRAFQIYINEYFGQRQRWKGKGNVSIPTSL